MNIETLQTFIKAQTGIELQPCDYFTGLQEHKNKKYYNFLLNERVSESQDFLRLQRIAQNSKLVRAVEPNGVNRVAVFF